VRYGDKDLVFDVAHNPQAADRLCETLRIRYPERSITVVAGIMADKEYTAMIAGYTRLAASLILTCPATARAASADQLSASLPAAYRGSVKTAPDVPRAVTLALQSTTSVVCITGSFYTVGEAMRFLDLTPYD
jgi:dihydrofolate synthase/folylpolyglutamate synthase